VWTVCCPFQEPNTDSSSMQPLVWALCWLSYPGSLRKRWLGIRVSIVLSRVTIICYAPTTCSRLTWERSWRWQCNGALRSGCCVRLLRNSASTPTRHLSSGSGSIWLLLAPWTKLREKHHSTVTTCASSCLFEPPEIHHFVVCSVFSLYVPHDSHNKQLLFP
jgi:hypothetical protein